MVSHCTIYKVSLNKRGQLSSDLDYEFRNTKECCLTLKFTCTLRSLSKATKITVNLGH